MNHFDCTMFVRQVTRTSLNFRGYVSRSFHHQIYIDQFELSSTGFSSEEFHQRRKNLVDLIGKYLKNGEKFHICLPSAVRQWMGPDVAYFPFKQQSDFYYFTGCLQPNALVLLNVDEKRRFSTDLYLSSCPMRNFDEYQRWFGPIITDSNEICQIFGVDRVESIEKLFQHEISSSSILFYSSSSLNESNATFKTNFKEFLHRYSSSMRNDQLEHFLHHLRAIKSSNELKILRRACQMTSDAFIQTMKTPMKFVDNEAFLKAKFQFECEKSGAMSMAFYPVVAARGRSNILHYQQNNQKIDTNDLIMLDAGGLFKQYASDITRLWPLNGRFSSAHRQLYEILLTVQKHLIDRLKNVEREKLSRSQLNQLADFYMIKYLREESILSRTIDDEQAKNIVSRLCPTSVGHHLGLDVHDCETISFFDNLRPGNVITIEPGLYIPSDFNEIPSIYRGFATRIEDDVLLTENDCEILTSMCPKEINDLYSILDQRDSN